MRLVKRMRRHPLGRGLAWLLQVALLVSGVLYAPSQSRAQDIASKLAVVLDFGNLAVASPLAGDEAAAALTLALVQRGYEVTRRDEVEAKLKQIGVRAPFEPDEIKLIKQELDIRDLYSGSVIGVNESIGARSSVDVLLRIEQYDGDTGDMIKGAYGRGTEMLTSADTADREAGRASAIERAVAQALTRMDAQETTTAAVMSYSPPDRVLINKGRKQGVIEGMQFSVFRTKVDPENPNRSITVKVGRVQVTHASNDDAIARPIEETNQGINTHDQLREVFQLPAISNAEAMSGRELNLNNVRTGPSKPAGNKRWLGPFFGLLAGVAGVAALVVLATNSTNDAPSAKSSGAYLRQSAPGTNPSVEVAWGDRNWAPPKRYIGGYVVYRGQSSSFAALQPEAVGVVPGSNQRRFTDDPTWNEINAQVRVAFERITQTDVDVIEEILDVTIIHQSPQPGQIYYYKVRRIGPPGAATAPTVFQRSAVSAADGSAQLAARSARLRAQAGGAILRDGGNVRLRSVSRVRQAGAKRQITTIPPGPGYDTTLNPATDNSIPESTDVALSEASGSMGPVTYLVPPTLLGPDNNNMAQRVDDVGFQWQGVLGATEYVLQVATDTGFSNIVFSSSPIATTSSGQLTYRYNVTAAGYRQLSPNAQYFWRVGAKSTFGGQRAPEPFGYVFSSVYTFQTADAPPPAPR